MCFPAWNPSRCSAGAGALRGGSPRARDARSAGLLVGARPCPTAVEPPPGGTRFFSMPAVGSEAVSANPGQGWCIMAAGCGHEKPILVAVTTTRLTAEAERCSPASCSTKGLRQER